MVDVFLKAWNPIMEFEQISLNTLAQGLLYWEALAPISERWKEFKPPRWQTVTQAEKN